MFVYYFAHIPQPFGQLAEPFEEHPDLWLPRCVSEACDEVGSPTSGRRLGAGTTSASAGPLSRSVGSSAFPLRVESSEPRLPFGHLEADLEIAELGSSQTQLTFRGSYRASTPNSDPAEAALRHRQAEAIAKGIVERVAARLTAGPGAAPVPGNT
jgi:hypothetical protein